MAVSGVNSSSQPVYAQAQTDGTKLNADFDQFLRLLTTQLQNQDPLSPMDSAEFTNQLVQFSSVEQQIKTNTQLESLLTMQTLNLTALGLSFIGKDVEMLGDSFTTDGASGGDLGYVMPAGVKAGTLTILDKDNNVVYSTTPSFDQGRHTLKWDGKDSSGNMVPAGTYQMRVAALGENNASLNVQTYVPGYVESLESAEDGSLNLIVNGQAVAMTDVRKVSAPKS